MARALARSSRAPRATALTVHPIATTLLRQVGTPEFMAPEIVDGAGHGTDFHYHKTMHLIRRVNIFIYLNHVRILHFEVWKPTTALPRPAGSLTFES